MSAYGTPSGAGGGFPAAEDLQQGTVQVLHPLFRDFPQVPQGFAEVLSHQPVSRGEGGPFQGQVGPVAEVMADKGKVKFTVTVFGRETLVEADYQELEKL